MLQSIAMGGAANVSLPMCFADGWLVRLDPEMLDLAFQETFCHVF